ncbi:MAG: helix-turn-helix transcriptional regulator [Planctomycetes bacterium]|nr:helix-turn-helix transcriptional regulator [Planctomycetota bacterium]
MTPGSYSRDEVRSDVASRDSAGPDAERTEAPRPRRVETREQWEALTSPVRYDIVDLLRSIGPSSVTDLAKHMGRPADSLYYHLKKLQSVELVRQCGTRQRMGQSEAIFEIAGDGIDPGDPRDPQQRPFVAQLLSAVLRMTERDVKGAIARDDIVLDGEDKNLYGRRDLAWLDRRDLARVNRHLAAIGEIIESGRRSRKGELFALTTFLTRLTTEAVDQHGRRATPTD